MGLQMPSAAGLADTLDENLDALTVAFCKGDPFCLQVNSQANGAIKGGYDFLRFGSDTPEQIEAKLRGDERRSRELMAREFRRGVELTVTLAPAGLAARELLQGGRASLGLAKVEGEMVLRENLSGIKLADDFPAPTFAASSENPGVVVNLDLGEGGTAPGNGTPNRGLIYVLEGGNQRVRPRVSAAEVFEDSLPGAYSDAASGRRVVPALRFDPPASLKGGTRNPYIRFDAVDPSDAHLLIDRKLSLVRFPTKNGPMIPQAARIRETLLALDQNPGFRVVYEFPDAAAARSTRSVLRELGVADPRLTVRVAQ